MKWPAPTRAAHEAFCEAEGWTPVRSTHHVTYELHLDDGRILRTRISHSVDRSTYGPRLSDHILRDQLDVDDQDFWACVQDGTKPNRGEEEQPHGALPADLVHMLLNRVRLSEAEVAAMNRDEAITRMQQYWVTSR